MVYRLLLGCCVAISFYERPATLVSSDPFFNVCIWLIFSAKLILPYPPPRNGEQMKQKHYKGQNYREWKKPPVTSGYREINRPLDFVCLGQMRRGLKRSVPPKLDFVSSQTILFVLTSSETIRNSRNTALLSVFAYISWKRRLKPIFMSTCFFLSRDSITPQKWISSAAWPPASRFIIHSESYRTLQNCTPCRVEDVFMSNTSRWHFKSSNLVVYTFYTLILRCLYLIGDTKVSHKKVKPLAVLRSSGMKWPYLLWTNVSHLFRGGRVIQYGADDGTRTRTAMGH